MTQYNFGKVVPRFRGDFNIADRYDELDVVFWNGSSWVCKTDSTIGVYPSDAAKWQIIARKGAETELTPEQIQTIKEYCLHYLENAGAVFDSDYNHTSNDFSDFYETKLNGIESGAQVNVQADWSQNDPTKDDFIKNKPSYTETDNNFSNELKAKLESIDASAEPNVQADWGEINSASPAFIQNKPILAEVATTGSYNSLSNKPTLFSGNYNDLTNKPTIPSRLSQLTNDQVFIVPPTLYDKGEQTNVTISTLNGNEKYFCSNLQSLTIESFGENTYMPSWIYFEDTPDVSLNLSVPNTLKWVTETPLFYAEETSRHYCLRIEDKIGQLLILANGTTTYPDEVEEAARWRAAEHRDDPENWEDWALF